ncbi:MAG: hypothetical protein L6Q51_12005 [Cyclobacteriaceae bacterium]|nr:hypothetical protein [Cyclobacteriaceae bacterium]
MRVYATLFALITLTTCNNLGDAELSERVTFMKVFNGIQGIEAAAAELTPEGYIIVGNMTIARDSVVTVVFKTDKRGNRTGNMHYYQGGSGNAIKALPNGNGYLIVGEKIKTDPNATPTDNIDIVSAHMLHISNDLDSIKTIYLSDGTANVVKTDYRAVSLTVTPAGKVVVLGTYQTSLTAPERPYLQRYNADLSTIEWYEEFASINRSYRNAKSIHFINGNFIWASAVAQEQQNFDFSYVSVPFVQEGSVFVNYSLLGETTSQSLRPNDIQPAKSVAFGYGITGTRASTNGSGANAFFARTDVSGNIIPATVKFFDAILSEQTGAIGETNSEIQDYGTAITGTSDGAFVLAGHYITNPQKGNGANDLVLIKLDINGNMRWMKTLGGTGSETVSTIRETDDQGLLICGTNVVGSVPSIFLIKTDKNGELKN